MNISVKYMVVSINHKKNSNRNREKSHKKLIPDNN